MLLRSGGPMWQGWGEMCSLLRSRPERAARKGLVRKGGRPSQAHAALQGFKGALQ